MLVLRKKQCKPVQKAIGVGNADLDGMLQRRMRAGDRALRLARRLMLHVLQHKLVSKYPLLLQSRLLEKTRSCSILRLSVCILTNTAAVPSSYG